MNKLSTRPVVAVDADTLVFGCAAAAETRSIEVLHQPTGIKKTFSNRTEFKQLMKSKEKEITPEYLISDRQEAEVPAAAFRGIKNAVEQILDNYMDCDVVFCCGAKDNFRESLAFPKPYKGNRTATVKPLLLKDSQQYIQKQYGAVQASGMEVDDLVGILGYEALRSGRRGIVLSPDGDSRQFIDLSLGKYESKPNELVDIKFWHSIEWVNDQMDTYGFPWMVMQHCIGDSTDGIKPTHICGAKYGEKGFYNEVKDMKTPEELVKFTIAKYKKWYPKEFEYTDWNGNTIKADWKFILNLYWKATTMQRVRGVEPDYWDFLKEYEIQHD